MLAHEHPDARCPHCASRLRYGLKREGSGWKIQYLCPPSDGCGCEFSVGRIDHESVDSEDEAYRRAERLGETLY